MNVKDLTNRVVLITGASSGIGRETALLCARRRTRLVICDLNEDGLKETAEAICARQRRVRADRRRLRPRGDGRLRRHRAR